MGHTNGTIRVQGKTESERLNIQRVKPFTEKIVLLTAII
jgi:hypothetical protein